MLTAQKGCVQLPQNDLVYLAFRLAIKRNLLDLGEVLAFGSEPRLPTGFLSVVPFLAGLPLQVQIDLLAETWARHSQPDCLEATLLDAAVLYAACRTASRLANLPEMAVLFLRRGPRELDLGILDGASEGLQKLFYGFWKLENFLWLNGVQKLPKDHLIRYQLGLTKSEVRPMYDALRRACISPEITTNLTGLLNEQEIENAVDLLQSRRPWRTDEDGTD